MCVGRVRKSTRGDGVLEKQWVAEVPRDGKCFSRWESESVGRRLDRRCGLQSRDTANAWWPDRKGTQEKKIAGLSPIFRLLLVLPLADPILQASGKTILSRRNSSWPYLLFYIHQHWQGFLCLKLLTLVMLLPHKRYWKRCKQAHMLGVTRKIPVNLTHLSL